MKYDEILKHLSNYTPKDELEGFPIEIIARMCFNQISQGNNLNPNVFEKRIDIGRSNGGFKWSDTNEGQLFWIKVIRDRNFDYFFENYPERIKNTNKVQVSLMEIADWKDCEVDDIEIIN